MLRSSPVPTLHHRGVDHHAVVDELRGAGGVRHDPADRAGDEVHVLGAVGFEPVGDGGLVAQVELLARRGQHLDGVIALKAADHGGADEAAVTGDEDARRCGHAWPISTLENGPDLLLFPGEAGRARDQVVGLEEDVLEVFTRLEGHPAHPRESVGR